MTDWHAYFQEYRRKLIANAEAKAAREAREAELSADWMTVPMYALPDPTRAAGKVGTLARRLIRQGWDVKVAREVGYHPPVYLKDDSKNGDGKAGDLRYASYKFNLYTLVGVKRAGGKSLALKAEYTHQHGKTVGPSLDAAMTYDPILGKVWRTSDTKPRPQRAWEKEDDIPAPIGLGQWLDIVCPKPAPKPRKKKEEA